MNHLSPAERCHAYSLAWKHKASNLNDNRERARSRRWEEHHRGSRVRCRYCNQHIAWDDQHGTWITPYTIQEIPI